MFYQLHPISVSRPFSISDLTRQGTTYPIGMSLNDFLDLFSDVKAISINGLAIIDPASSTVASSDIIGAIDSLDSQNNNSDSSFINSEANRSIYPIGNLDSDGQELLLSSLPTALCDYPVIIAGNGGGVLTLNLGKTIFYNGLFFPYISLIFSNGCGSTSVGPIIGSANIQDYNLTFPIYGNDSNISNFSNAFATANIKITERYSSIVADTPIAKINEVLVFKTDETTSLISYEKAFLGSVEAKCLARPNSLFVTIPPNAKSGPIRFSTNGPPYDTFLSYQDFTIS